MIKKIEFGTEANRIALTEWKAFCTTMHRPEKKPSTRPNRALNNEQLGTYNRFLRFGYSHPRMWTQYGENHKGVCVIFDGLALNTNIHEELGRTHKIRSGRVIYIITFPLCTPYTSNEKKSIYDGIRNHYIKNYKEIFLMKYPDWEHEVEYRWLVHSLNDSPEYISIEGAMRAIILGVDFPKGSQQEILDLCRDLSVSVGEMTWDNGLPIARFGSLYKPKT